MESKELSPIEELNQKIKNCTDKDNDVSWGTEQGILISKGFAKRIKNRLSILEDRSNHWRKLYNEELLKNADLKSQSANAQREYLLTRSILRDVESQLAEKDKEIERLKIKTIVDKVFSETSEDNHNRDVYYENKKLKSQISELKENYKRDAVDFAEWIRKQIISDNIKCYEDDGRFTLWIPYTPYGSRLTVVELYDYYKQTHETNKTNIQ